MSQPKDFETWPRRAQASYVTLDKTRREIIEAIADQVEYDYESDAAAGNERVETELLALVYAELECYR